MNKLKFSEIVEQKLEYIKKTMETKNIEYAPSEDVLHNFNKGSQLSGKIREEVLWGFALKHLISLMDIIDELNIPTFPSIEKLEEKTTDLINYLILLEACIKEKINLHGNNNNKSK